MRVIATEHPVPFMPVPGEPDKGHIQPEPAEPETVPEHSYYLRRIASGELKRVDESTATSAKGGAKTSAKGSKE